MDDILTIRDVAARLKLGERTVTSMLVDGELPGFKLRGQWRLRRDHFERWLAAVAVGGDVFSVTADILSNTERSPLPAATVQTPAEGDADEPGDDLKALRSERVSQAELHRRFIAALGGSVASHAPLDSKPFELDLGSPLPTRLRLYIFTATRPPGGRPIGEHKIQLIAPGQKRGERASLDQSDGRIVLLAGYAADEDVFVLWDAGLYTDFAWSRNVQVKASTIVEATAGKIAEQKRQLRPPGGGVATEILIACPPSLLAEALARRIDLTRERMVNG